jgi:hypothetical protein
MEMTNEKSAPERRYVIEKIKRISIAVDRREFWIMILLGVLFAGMIVGLIYYILL